MHLGESEDVARADVLQTTAPNSWPTQRERLFARLSRIQSSISHRAPLQEVLDAITSGISELLGDECAAVRLIDPDDPDYATNVSYAGLAPEMAQAIHRTPVGQGAGGRAIAEGRLVVIHDYDRTGHAIPTMARARLKAAMAAPLREGGEIVGSLIAASFRQGRVFSEAEQEALVAFAEHASLALTDARAVQDMRDAQRSKEMFLAMVSHELKTPLTVIMAALRTLEERSDALDEPIRKEILGAACERARELGRLVDRLLQGSRAGLAGRKEDVALSDVIEGAVFGFCHERSVVIGGVADEWVHVNATALKETIGILLENATKHSPAGSEVLVEAAIDDGEVVLSVTNRGSLPQDVDPATLFEPFRRGSATSSGVGLGLYIVDQLAQALHGRVEAISDNERVTFSLCLPLELASRDAAGLT